MKINRLETHDRLLEFTKNTDIITEGCEECLRNVPEAINFPFYIFAHTRAIDMDEKLAIIADPSIPFEQKKADERLIWSPRITKPPVSTNSYLFLVVRRPDLLRVIWLLPKRELWEQYAPGKMTHNPDVWTSIKNYQNHKKKLGQPEPDGPTEHHERLFRKIYGEEAHRKKVERSNKNLMEGLWKAHLNEREKSPE